MSSFFMAFCRHPAASVEGIDAAVMAQIVKYPHDIERQCAVGSASAAQALRWYGVNDQKTVLPLKVDHAVTPLLLAGNLRLDNRAALQTSLCLAADASDAEMVCAAYHAYGEDLALHLHGDFGFALYDQGLQKLLLVRDHMGVCPLYYRLSGQHCLVSDDIEVLLAEPGVSHPLNDNVVAEWWLYRRVYNQSETFFSTIRKCPRATVMRVCKDHVTTRVYWRMEDAPALPNGSLEAYARQLRCLIEKAIGDRVDCADPMGAHLSGGLDSSPIAIMAGRACRGAGQSFYTFNWCKPDEGDDPQCFEWALARQIAQNEGLKHAEVGALAEELLRQLTTHSLSRIGTTMFQYEYPLLRQAQAEGVRQIFSGFGGDEGLTFRGRENLVPLVRNGRWLSAASKLKQQANPRQRLVPARLLVRFARLVKTSFTRDLKSLDISLIEQRQQAIQRLNALSPDFRKFAATRIEPLPHRLNGSLRSVQQWMLGNGYHQERMECWAALGRRHGIRYLYPFLDFRVVEFSLGLPENSYYRDGQGRHLYRIALNEIIPDFLRSLQKPAERLRVKQLLRELHGAVVQCELTRPVSSKPNKYLVSGEVKRHFAGSTVFKSVQKTCDALADAELLYTRAMLNQDTCVASVSATDAVAPPAVAPISNATKTGAT